MQNKTLIFAGALLVALTACNGPANSIDSVFAGEQPWVNSVHVITDTKTGCDYLIFKHGYGGGIIPRLNSKGSPLCKEPNQ